ncbi:MAG: ATP-dependent helicase [Sporichthyaceae bacterium]
MARARPSDPLAGFAPATRDWFTSAFAAPTPAQVGAWAAIAQGRHALVVAPTGSGKTLAAFLAALDALTSTPRPAERERRCRVLYISPLKALAVDVERNLRSPLAGISQAARRLGLPEPSVEVGMRTGDTPAEDRRRFATRPPDILITTPESLFLLLTSRARESLVGVETVIIDEVHAVAATKRGAHLALSLERLDALLDRPAQRIGLSATVRPVDEVARFLGGAADVEVVNPPAEKIFDIAVVVPVEDMRELGQPTGEFSGSAAGSEPRTSIWPHVEERIHALISGHRSTIVFANSRRLAERLTQRLNEVEHELQTGETLPPPGAQKPPAQLMGASDASRGIEQVLARAHHGSVSKEQRAIIEDELKTGRLRAVVATSSLELGIDMGAVDLVVQVESPPSVASGLQRVGRAGHQVGAISRGIVFPKHRGDLVQTAVVAERMTAGQIEAIRIPRNPLDVLAQHIVSMVALDDWNVDDLADLLRRAAPFAALPQSSLEAVLDMLSGRYPSDEFAELRPRLVWDRVTGILSGRPGAQRLAVTSGGTIPDRGMFGVFLVGEKQSRVGELDEEMVYESRVSDVFTLGSSSWRIEDITHDKVLVSPAPGQPGRLPFWKGDSIGRPLELGRAVGAFLRELARLDDAAAHARLAAAGLDTWAADNLLLYLAEQRAATTHVPDDRTIVIERFRDELGDWRLVVHSPFGAQVHAPWALAVAARLRERFGVDVQAMHADDGIVLRLPDIDDLGSTNVLPLTLDPAEVDALVTAEVGGSALFSSRFRECAARALLLPRRDPGKRSPLWQQRQRSAQLLTVAAQYASFPILLETMRECLQDVFDVPGLIELMTDIESARVRVVEVETSAPSPFARSLLFGYVAAFMYEGDSPLAERRAAALALDSTLLAELLGQADLRELLDLGAVESVEAELQRLAPDRKVRDLEGVADLVRLLGPVTTDEAVDRGADPHWLVELEASRRVIRVRIAGAEHWAAIEDAGRLRDALGAALPVGVPVAFTEGVKDPLGDLIARFARTHGPFAAAAVAERFGIGVAVARQALARLAASGRIVEGEFRPGGSGTEWCDAEVLRRLRRLSIARLRKEIEPVEPAALARFLPAWQHVGTDAVRGVDGVLRVVEQLQGAAVPASALERLILPARVIGYTPALLDELTTAGEVLWSGHGSLPGDDGWVSLHLPESADLLLPDLDPETASTPLHTALIEALADSRALFFRALAERASAAVQSEPNDATVAAALWDLVWAGWLTNDTLAPLRSLLGGGGAHKARAATPRAHYRRLRREQPSTLFARAAEPIEPVDERSEEHRRPALDGASLRRGSAGRPTSALRAGPPTVAGRWSLLPERSADPTRKAQAGAEALLERHGILTRGAVVAERTPGGFAAAYRVLAAYEQAGRCRRGYFVEGLGAAQFALPGAVDRLRASPPDGHRRGKDAATAALVLAATDPANPYGGALAWPSRGPEAGGHRPGRKAGALVVLAHGELVLYVERGGKTLLSWPVSETLLQPAADALALSVREGALGKLTVEKADGESVLASPLGAALETAGFRATPRGLRLRAF